MTPAAPPTIEADGMAGVLLADLQALGVTLHADGESLRLQGRRDLLTPFMLEGLRLHKADLLRLLVHTTTADDDSGIVWTAAEWATMRESGIEPSDLHPLAVDARRELADLGAVIVGVEGEADPSPPTELRHEAASILKRARRRGRELAIALRDALHERLAICTIDGGLCDAEAWHVAAIQLREGVRCGA